MVEATEATPAFAITDLHSVPGVHTHFASTWGLYFSFSSAVEAGAAHHICGDVLAIDRLAVLLEDPILAIAQPTLQVLELQVGWSCWEVRGREELVLARAHAGRNFEA